MTKRGNEGYLSSGEERRERKTRFLRRMGFRGGDAFQADSAAGAALYAHIESNYEEAKREWNLRKIEESQRLPQRVLRIVGTVFGIQRKEERFWTIDEYLHYNCSRIVQLHEIATRVLPWHSRGQRRLLNEMDLTKDTARELLIRMQNELGFSSIDVMAKSAERIQSYTRAVEKKKK
jgi:hypothetical protein